VVYEELFIYFWQLVNDPHLNTLFSLIQAGDRFDLRPAKNIISQAATTVNGTG
jgi:hypothetical protein